MQIENNLQVVIPETNKLGRSKNNDPPNPVKLPENDITDKPQEVKNDNFVNIIDRPDLKEAAKEMLAEERQMGKFEDKDWIGQAKELQIGPDIRYALTSTNPDFLKRIIWGPLTSGEFREVYYRLKEIEKKGLESNNILKGQIIDLES